MTKENENNENSPDEAFEFIGELISAFDTIPANTRWLVGDLSPEQIKELQEAGFTVREISKDEI